MRLIGRESERIRETETLRETMREREIERELVGVGTREETKSSRLREPRR